MELKYYFSIIRKRLIMILSIMVLSCVAVWVYSSYFVDPQYQASAKLVVNQYKDSSTVATNMNLESINSNIRLIKTYKEIISTPRIMELVVSQYPEIHKTANELIKLVTVNSVNDTQVMSVTVRDSSFASAARIVNAVSQVFQAEIPKVLKVDNVSILNEVDPSGNPSPVSPNVKLNIMISFVLSLMISLGLAFLLDYLDDTVKTEEDVREWVGLPVLIAIPEMKESDVAVSRMGNKTTVKNENDLGREKNVSFDA